MKKLERKSPLKSNLKKFANAGSGGAIIDFGRKPLLVPNCHKKIIIKGAIAPLIIACVFIFLFNEITVELGLNHL